MPDQLAAVEALEAEDVKLVTLARAGLARSGADEGAAVRDETGRTYTAVTVALQAAMVASSSSMWVPRALCVA